MLFVYGDESTDETQQRVCAVAGVIGTEASWNEMESKWASRTGGIPFHANECDSDLGQYANIPHAENKALYKDLTVILVESGLAGFGVAIDLISQQRVWPGTHFDLSYYKAFMHVLLRMNKCATFFGETVGFTFDSRKTTQHNTTLLYKAIRENEPGCLEHFVATISFDFAKDNSRIQAADLLARETMKALDNRIGPVKRDPRKSWLALHGTGRFFIEAYDGRWFDDLKNNYATLERRVGFDRRDYVNWLNDRSRQHNQSNLLMFIEWASRNVLYKDD